MLTLFLMLLSPLTSPSPRVEDPRIWRTIEKQIKAEGELKEYKAKLAEVAKARMKRILEMQAEPDKQIEKKKQEVEKK